MDFVVKKGEVVVLDNKENYLVMESVVFEDESYLFVMKLEDDINLVFDPSLRKVKVVKEIVNENKEYFLETITNSELIKKLGEELRKKIVK